MRTVIIPEDTVLPSGASLPFGVSVEINDVVHKGAFGMPRIVREVTLHLRFHKMKKFKMPHCYSAEYTTWQILGDHHFLSHLAHFR